MVRYLVDPAVLPGVLSYGFLTGAPRSVAPQATPGLRLLPRRPAAGGTPAPSSRANARHSPAVVRLDLVLTLQVQLSQVRELEGMVAALGLPVTPWVDEGRAPLAQVWALAERHDQLVRQLFRRCAGQDTLPVLTDEGEAGAKAPGGPEAGRSQPRRRPVGPLPLCRARPGKLR